MALVDPHSYADPDQGRVTRLGLILDVDFDAKRLTGTATLGLEGAKGGHLDLDTRDLDIQKVVLGDGTQLKFTLGDKDEVLGQKLSVVVPDGTDEITVHYATSPNASALQWLDPALTAGKKHPYLFSQCQAIHARSMAPLQDTPRCRIPYTAEITVPDPLVAVMSAAPGEKHKGVNAETTTWQFEMPQPIPPYLLALAVGNLVSEDLGPRSRVYTEPEMLEACAWEFATVDDMLRKAEELFGEYRWGRFDFLVMPPSFPYGGMENPRLTFLTPSLIAGDRSLVEVLAHELAHSWTGNLVTNATNEHFWLNEGFTVWAERRINEVLEGIEAVTLSKALGREALQAEIERFGADSPYTALYSKQEGVDPDDVYSQVPYEKGCLLVTLMEETVGREKFDAFLKKYMDEFQFRSLDTEEFLSFLEKQLPGLAEQIGAKDWIYGPGVPANEPKAESARLSELTKLATGWHDGTRPDPDEAKEWPVAEWLVYLGNLPNDIGEDGCKWIDDTFGLTTSGNSEILCKWLVMAIENGYEPVFGKTDEFLGSIGRMKYLKPLYKALSENPKSEAMAGKIFDKHKSMYHPIARGGLESILGVKA
jgi:leukotriene A-4 hydrolase/aminopeptidase